MLNYDIILPCMIKPTKLSLNALLNNLIDSGIQIPTRYSKKYYASIL